MHAAAGAGWAPGSSRPPVTHPFSFPAGKHHQEIPLKKHRSLASHLGTATQASHTNAGPPGEAIHSMHTQASRKGEQAAMKEATWLKVQVKSGQISSLKLLDLLPGISLEGCSPPTQRYLQTCWAGEDLGFSLVPR